MVECVGYNSALGGSIPPTLLKNTIMKITVKNKRSIRRQVDLELGIIVPKTKVYKNKKKYNRKKKHKNYD